MMSLKLAVQDKGWANGLEQNHEKILPQAEKEEDGFRPRY